MTINYDEESDEITIDLDYDDEESQATLDYIFEQHRKAQNGNSG